MTGNAAVEARIADALATPGLHVIADHFPLMITVTHGDTDEDGLARYMRELEAAYDRREPIVWLSIIVGTGKNREHIRRLGEWMKKNRPTIAAYGMATVFVTRSTMYA